MYKYLLFDIDQTLLDFEKAEAKAVSTVLKGFGIAATKKTVRLYSGINLSCWKRYEKGEITRDEIFQNRVFLLGKELGVKIDADEFSKRYLSELSAQGQKCVYAERLLKRLKKKGYKIAAATNGTLASQKGRIAVSGIGKYFDSGIFISEEIGLKKPDVEFFDYALNAMGVKNKAEVLVIGDSPSSDIAGAVASGLDCCLVGKQSSDEIKAKPTYFCKNLKKIISVCRL